MASVRFGSREFLVEGLKPTTWEPILGLWQRSEFWVQCGNHDCDEPFEALGEDLAPTQSESRKIKEDE